MIGLIAQKSEMSKVVLKNGDMVGVTWLKVSPNVVTQIKTVEKDGYSAVQLGAGEKKKYSKPMAGHLQKLDAKILWEVRVEDSATYNKGQLVDVSVFQVGDKVIITGISKGKGFAGTIKRHNFKSGPSSHGHDHHRQPGSIGAMGMPRVQPGKRMAGHMGVDRITAKNLLVVAVDQSSQRLAVKGSVPGGYKSFILVRKHA